MATFVLVHGAYQGGWIWKPVAERLRRAGHAVYAPTLDGCAERKHQLRPGISASASTKTSRAMRSAASSAVRQMTMPPELVPTRTMS